MKYNEADEFGKAEMRVDLSLKLTELRAELNILEKNYKSVRGNVYPHKKPIKNLKARIEYWEGISKQVNSAMMGVLSRTNGGIDFDTKDVEFTSSGAVDPAMMNQMLNINPKDVIGFTIGRITITPIPSVYQLLGLTDPKEENKDSDPSKPYLKDLAFNRKKSV